MVYTKTFTSPYGGSQRYEGKDPEVFNKKNGYLAMMRFLSQIGKERIIQISSYPIPGMGYTSVVHVVFYEADGLDESIINFPTK